MSKWPLDPDVPRHDEVPLLPGQGARRRPVGPSPFVPRPRLPPGFGRGPVRLPRIPVPRLPGPLGLIELIDKLDPPKYPAPGLVNIDIPGMERCDGPYYQTPENWYGWMNFDYNSMHCGDPDFQLGGQVPGSVWWTQSPLPDQAGYPQVGFGQGLSFGGQVPNSLICYYGYLAGSAWRGLEHSSWYRVFNKSPLEIYNVGVGIPLPDPVPNPNMVRQIPANPQPYTLGHGTTANPNSPDGYPEPQGAAIPVAEQLVMSPAPAAWGFGFGLGLAPGLDTDTKTAPKPQPTPQPDRLKPPPLPAPPAENTKEKKAQSKSAALGRLLYNALDAASENADIVDALFKALPCATQKRWKKGRKPRKAVDQFGQYGANGADWKLQALWHNWHLMDPVEGWQNIAWNLLEDQLYGLVHKTIPVQAGGPGMEQQFLAFADLLKQIPLHQPKECP